jgi:hypothetical protein
VLKHCAANRKRRLSALPNVGPYIHDVKISGFTRSSIYDISRLRVNAEVFGGAYVERSIGSTSRFLTGLISGENEEPKTYAL